MTVEKDGSIDITDFDWVQLMSRAIRPAKLENAILDGTELRSVMLAPNVHGCLFRL